MIQVNLYVDSKKFRNYMYGNRNVLTQLPLKFLDRFIYTTMGNFDRENSEINLNLPALMKFYNSESYQRRFDPQSLEEKILHRIEHHSLHVAINEEDLKRDLSHPYNPFNIATEENLVVEAQRQREKWNYIPSLTETIGNKIES